MSGIPYWYTKDIKLNINGKILVIDDMYCVGDRRGMHNSDELVVKTSDGTFNLSDDGVTWKLSQELLDDMTAREVKNREETVRRVEEYKNRTPRRIVEDWLEEAKGWGPARSQSDAEDLEKILKYIKELEFKVEDLKIDKEVLSHVE